MPQNFNYHGDVVVFDLDDTLATERDYVRSGFQLIKRELSSRYPDVDFKALPFRLNTFLNARKPYFNLLEEILRQNIPELKKTPEKLSNLIKELIDHYRSHIPNPQAYSLRSGVKETLEALRSHGIVTALITDGRSITQRCKIEALGIERFIAPENILISEETGFDKTSPENFSEIVRNFPEAKRFFYIADNPQKDFIMPNILGWISCLAPLDFDNVHEYEEPADILKGPAYKMKDFTTILEIFNLSSINI